ncbi:MAG: LptF/LptG family permease [Proteobacteria bacterium]|nr:LptF/LptG family permease [Pseudomonadota bacterium]
MILFFYVFRDFVRYVVGTLLLCVFLFLLFDFIHKTTRYIPRYNPETILLVRYYIYSLPNLVVQALPIASLLASVITMVLLSRTNEITAMRAAGMGPLRTAMPIVVGGLSLCLVSILLGEWLLPRTAQKMHFIQEVLIERGSETQIAEGARWVKDLNLLYNFRDYDPITNVMTGVRVIETGDNFRPKRSLEARLATYRPDIGDWLLEDVKVLYFWPKGTLSYTERKDVMPVRIPVEPMKLKKERRQPNELSSMELSDIISKGAVSGGDVLSYRVELHTKLAFHLAPFVVCLIGLRFGYRSERTMETARGVLLAVGVGMSYWFFLNAARALAKRGVLHPIPASWSADLILMAYSLLNLWRLRQKK